jgi:cellulose biosynthesis protein BcsQ
MAEPQKNNLVAIASGKGGVGKTWLSTTLAHLIARSGRSVLLFDGDIGLANVDVQLGLTHRRIRHHRRPLGIGIARHAPCGKAGKHGRRAAGTTKRI